MSTIEELEPAIGEVVTEAGEGGLSTEQVRRALLERGYVISDALLSGWLLVMGEQRHLIRWESGRWHPETKESGLRRGLDQAVLHAYERAWPRGLGHEDAWAILEGQARYESRLAVQLSVIRLARHGDLRMTSPGTWAFQVNDDSIALSDSYRKILRALDGRGVMGVTTTSMWNSLRSAGADQLTRETVHHWLAALRDKGLARQGERVPGLWFITRDGHDVIQAGQAGPE